MLKDLLEKHSVLTHEGVMDIFKSKNIKTTIRTICYGIYLEDCEFHQKGISYIEEYLMDETEKIIIHNEDVEEVLKYLKKFISGNKKTIIIDKKLSNIDTNEYGEHIYTTLNSELKNKHPFNWNSSINIIKKVLESNRVKDKKTVILLKQYIELMIKVTDEMTKENSYTDEPITENPGLPKYAPESALTIVETLNYESGSEYIKENMKDLGVVCDEVTNLVLFQNKLSNESALVDTLNQEGYNVTSESAVDVAKDVIEKIKKAIKFLIDKFMLIFNKIKNFLISTKSKVNKIYENLKKEVKNINNDANESLLHNETFSEKFPIVSDFSKKDNMLKILTTMNDSIHSLQKIGDTVAFERSIDLKDTWAALFRNNERYILGMLCFKPALKYLYCHSDSDQLEIKKLETESLYDTKNKKVLSKDDLLSLINKALDVNDTYGLFLNNIEKSIKSLENMKPVNNSRFFNVKNIESNSAISINACKIFLEHYEATMNDFAIILVHNIKCYKKDK